MKVNGIDIQKIVNRVNIKTCWGLFFWMDTDETINKVYEAFGGIVPLSTCDHLAIAGTGMHLSEETIHSRMSKLGCEWKYN